jgi:hypothetical protein
MPGAAQTSAINMHFCGGPWTSFSCVDCRPEFVGTGEVHLHFEKQTLKFESDDMQGWRASRQLIEVLGNTAYARE